MVGARRISISVYQLIGKRKAKMTSASVDVKRVPIEQEIADVLGYSSVEAMEAVMRGRVGLGGEAGKNKWITDATEGLSPRVFEMISRGLAHHYSVEE